MNVAALFTWMITILAGLVLLIIWIIEYDPEFQTATATRLPVPVISAHALLGLGGLMLWIGYLVEDQQQLAWATVATLVTVAALGLIMAVRWIRVYRAFADPGPPLPGATLPLRNGASRCRSLSATASWPSPPSSWCCSPRSALVRVDPRRRAAKDPGASLRACSYHASPGGARLASCA